MELDLEMRLQRGEGARRDLRQLEPPTLAQPPETKHEFAMSACRHTRVVILRVEYHMEAQLQTNQDMYHYQQLRFNVLDMC